MRERKLYYGKLNEISAIWTDYKPEGLVVEKESIVYTPSVGKVFMRDGNFYDSVVIAEGIDIKDFKEVDDTRSQPDKEALVKKAE